MTKLMPGFAAGLVVRQSAYSVLHREQQYTSVERATYPQTFCLRYTNH